jgi:hypothetical protein
VIVRPEIQGHAIRAQCKKLGIRYIYDQPADCALNDADLREGIRQRHHDHQLRSRTAQSLHMDEALAGLREC